MCVTSQARPSTGRNALSITWAELKLYQTMTVCTVIELSSRPSPTAPRLSSRCRSAHAAQLPRLAYYAASQLEPPLSTRRSAPAPRLLRRVSARAAAQLAPRNSRFFQVIGPNSRLSRVPWVKFSNSRLSRLFQVLCAPCNGLIKTANRYS